MDSNKDSGTQALSRMSFRFSAYFLLALVISSGGLFGFARIARADPHAVFYTAIAQQQLFFNVLAALDQADYVETQFDREQRIQERAGVTTTPRFGAETQPLITATDVDSGSSSGTSQQTPGVSGLLTRLLTLEGNDLYTDSLVRSLGAEVGRRVATDELLRVLCDYALGYTDCDVLAPGADANAYEKKRREAMVIDPVDWATAPVLNGVLPALSSGIEDRSNQADEPKAYSRDIAAWQASVRGRNDQALHNQLLRTLLVNSARPYVNSLYNYPYERFTASGGRLFVAPDSNGEIVSAQSYLAALQGATFAPLVVGTIAAAAADRIALQQGYLEAEGALGEANIVPATNSSGQVGELITQINLPAASRVGIIHSLPTILGLLDTSQQFASPAGVDKPGDVELVNRPGAGGEETSGSSPLGANTTSGQQGAVAGFFDAINGNAEDLYAQLYKDPKRPTSPAANVVAGHLEDGALHALDAITEGIFSKKRTGTSHFSSSTTGGNTTGGNANPNQGTARSGFRPPARPGGFFQ